MGATLLRPLGDRILIKPEKPSDTTDSGLLLVEHRKPENMGTVVAVGSCPHPLKHEAEDLAQRLATVVCGYCDGNETGGQCLVKDAAHMLRDVTRREPSVKVGDTVLFSWTSGQELHLEESDERYLLLREDDLLAIVEW